MIKNRRQLFYDDDYIREVQDHINYEKLFYEGKQAADIKTTTTIENNSQTTTTKISENSYRLPKNSQNIQNS